jgi:hypothetical protein
LTLDYDARTFDVVVGYRFLTRTYHGTFDDVAYIYAQAAPQQYGRYTYAVFSKLKRSRGRRLFAIDYAADKEDLLKRAGIFASKLGARLTEERLSEMFNQTW